MPDFMASYSFQSDRQCAHAGIRMTERPGNITTCHPRAGRRNPLPDSFRAVNVTTHTSQTADAARVTGNQAWSSMSRIIAGMVLYGALGFAIGSWLGNPQAGLAVGVIVGVALGLLLSSAIIGRLGGANQALELRGSANSWSAKMSRARIQRASEGQTP